ncbi:MAG: hypothetical protein H7062_15315 [Candidatus Saccharimonas sp.]|nr:hypothetical protein [Planctomycetaceae bacterium]
MEKSSPARIGMKIVIVLIAIAATSAVWNVWQVEADDDLKPDLSLSAFMRKKLDASSQILEGLTTEDAELIQKGAKTLTELSKTEKWQILSDPEYREYSLDFRINARKLADAADKGNFDNAALQWFDAMKNCIECHQHVRRERAEAKKK